MHDIGQISYPLACSRLTSRLSFPSQLVLTDAMACLSLLLKRYLLSADG